MALEIPIWWQGISVVLLGLCLGSFLNVVIIRLPRGRSIVSPSSRCGWCRSALTLAQNLPILGFLFSKGRCKKCGIPFSSRYLWIEVLSAVMTFAIWSTYGWTFSSLIMGSFALSLIAISFIDLDLKIIPDELSLGGWAVVLILTALSPQYFRLSLMEAVVGGIVGYGFFWIISRLYAFVRHEEGLGGGDVKLMGFVGAILGVQGVVTTVFVGALVGSLVGVFFVLVRGKTKHFPIPFGPFLAMGALVSLFHLDGWFWG